MRHRADKAEQDFFAQLLGGSTLEKDAVEFDPGMADMLELGSLSPEALDQIEGQAASIDEVPADAEEDAPLQAQPAPAIDVDGFDRADAPPAVDDDDGELPVAEPPLPDRTTVGRLLSDKRAHPIKILEVLTARYGTEWTEWEPATLWWSLRRDLGPVGELARNKIGALRVAVTTDVPWLDWDVFEDSGLAWNDVIPIIGEFQPMTPMQTAFAISVLKEIRADEPFDQEVKAYIAAILEEHGWVYAPPEYFDTAQELLDRRVWLVGFREQVAQAWAKLQHMDPATIEWNYNHPLDVHVLKLMTVKHYLAERAALRDKLVGAAPTAVAAQPPVP